MCFKYLKTFEKIYFKVFLCELITNLFLLSQNWKQFHGFTFHRIGSCSMGLLFTELEAVPWDIDVHSTSDVKMY